MDNVDDDGGEEKKESEMEGVLGSEERTKFLFAQVQSLLKDLDSTLDDENMEDAAGDAVNSKQRKDTEAISVDSCRIRTGTSSGAISPLPQLVADFSAGGVVDHSPRSATGLQACGIAAH